MTSGSSTCGSARSVVHDVGSLIIAALTLLAIVLGLGIIGIAVLAVFDRRAIFNLVLLGYGCRRSRRARAAHARNAAARLQHDGRRGRGRSRLAYLSLEVRTFFHGDVLSAAAPQCDSTPIRWCGSPSASAARVGIALRAQSSASLGGGGGPHHPQGVSSTCAT